MPKSSCLKWTYRRPGIDYRVAFLTEAQLYHSFNHHKWLLYQIRGGKIVRDLQIDHPLATEIWPIKLIVTLSVSEGVTPLLEIR